MVNKFIAIAVILFVTSVAVYALEAESKQTVLPSKEVIEKLLDELAVEGVYTNKKALKISRLGKAIAPELFAILKSLHNEERSEVAAEMLGFIADQEILNELVELYTDQAAYRSYVLSAFCWSARDYELVLESIRTSLKSSEKDSLIKASVCIQQFAEIFRSNIQYLVDCVPNLAQLIRNQSEDVQDVALDALKELGPLAIGAVPILIEILDEAKPAIQATIAETLQKIEPGSNRILTALKKLRDSSKETAFKDTINEIILSSSNIKELPKVYIELGPNADEP